MPYHRFCDTLKAYIEHLFPVFKEGDNKNWIFKVDLAGERRCQLDVVDMLQNPNSSLWDEACRDLVPFFPAHLAELKRSDPQKPNTVDSYEATFSELLSLVYEQFPFQVLLSIYLEKDRTAFRNWLAQDCAYCRFVSTDPRYTSVRWHQENQGSAKDVNGPFVSALADFLSRRFLLLFCKQFGQYESSIVGLDRFTKLIETVPFNYSEGEYLVAEVVKLISEAENKVKQEEKRLADILDNLDSKLEDYLKLSTGFDDFDEVPPEDKKRLWAAAEHFDQLVEQNIDKNDAKSWEAAARKIEGEMNEYWRKINGEDQPTKDDVIKNLYVQVGKLQKKRKEIEQDDQLNEGMKREHLHGIDIEVERLLAQLQILEK